MSDKDKKNLPFNGVSQLSANGVLTHGLYQTHIVCQLAWREGFQNLTGGQIPP